MVGHIRDICRSEGRLSEKQKLLLGWDVPSFIRRMKERLAKIRGEESETSESFLIRHHYYKKSNALA